MNLSSSELDEVKGLGYIGDFFNRGVEMRKASVSGAATACF